MFDFLLHLVIAFYMAGQAKDHLTSCTNCAIIIVKENQ
jgi:hypothetical protein